ncbi:MAG: CinA family nicotinamide mononucleotide deamidase-related protein [Flavobacteriales bacterium]|jgi:nicotinamide-nucleotide amidase
MKAEIITIGDEILIGQTLDSNSAWLGENLGLIGVRISRIVTISDDEEEIISALNEAFSRVDLVLMTGGLGPTQDDITKKTLARYFNSEFYFNEEVAAGIKAYFNSIGREPLEVNLKQAELPEKCYTVLNNRGTASGMWFEDAGKVLMSMPGVPYEMKGLMRDEVFGKIKATFKTPAVYNRTILTIGVGESSIAAQLEQWETKLRDEGLGLAYLPSAGMVRLRVSGVGEDMVSIKKIVDQKITEALAVIGDISYGFDADSLAEIVGGLLKENNQTLSLAESCTGGYISHLLTSVAGSSEFYDGSVVTYSYDAKKNWVGVSPESLAKFGAVSKSVVEEMAVGVKEKFNTDYGISASGIAGPGGATDDKPVGTVWVGIATPSGVTSHLFTFGKHRLRNIIMTSNAALNILRKELLK